MASRAGKISHAPGAAVIAALLALLTLGTAAVVATRAGAFWPLPADWAALRFTVVQALLSGVVSIGLAVPLARALARRRFFGRGALITLMGVPFLLPVIVAVLGILAIFGRNGVVNGALAALGLPEISPYGLHGVVQAHVFLNLPLATRMVLMGWQAIPAERFRLALALGLPPAQQMRHLEWPMLRATLPGAAVAVFVICLTSFAVALTLGGGPAATTVELAIYQALRFDFAPARAAALAVVQFALCAMAAGIGWASLRDSGFGAGLGRMVAVPAPRGLRRVLDAVVIGLGAVFLAAPLLAVVLGGLAGLGDLPWSVWPAALRSVVVAVVSAVLTVGAALVLALAVARRAKGAIWYEGAATLPLAASALVMGAGLFLLVQGWILPARLALPVTVLVNATLALPFAYRLIVADARVIWADYSRLADALGLRGVARFRWWLGPMLARPIGLAAGVAAALSMGDLGVIALFADGQSETLPLVVQRLMGAYRSEAAAGAALVLVGLSFGIFALFDGVGRRAAT